jgi:hypothetical protein
LAGNELSPEAGKTYAVNGRLCSEGGGRSWIDGSAEIRQYCLFSLPESAESYLAYLNRNNPAMLEWQISGDPADQVITSQIWSFSVADRPSDHATWYTFHSVNYYRQFFSDNRRRRDAEADANLLFQSLAEQSAAEFVANLDIGDTGATVLQTDEPEITVEVVEEVAEPHDVEFSAAFVAAEAVITDAIAALPKRNNVKMFNLIKRRLSWFTDFSDAPCANYAGQGVGAGIDYVSPVISADDVCLTIGSFYNALVGYFDDFVCFDRADEIGKRKMQRAGHYLEASGRHFNRFMKKLSCEQSIL